MPDVRPVVAGKVEIRIEGAPLLAIPTRDRLDVDAAGDGEISRDDQISLVDLERLGATPEAGAECAPSGAVPARDRRSGLPAGTIEEASGDELVVVHGQRLDRPVHSLAKRHPGVAVQPGQMADRDAAQGV